MGYHLVAVQLNILRAYRIGVQIRQWYLYIEPKAFINTLLDDLLIVKAQNTDFDIDVSHVHYLLRGSRSLRILLALLNVLLILILVLLGSNWQVHHHFKFVEVEILFTFLKLLIKLSLQERRHIRLGHIVYAMELLPGRPLLVIQRILHLSLELLSSLQDLHETGSTLLILININLLPRFKILLDAVFCS